jgi:hypothetical protein
MSHRILRTWRVPRGVSSSVGSSAFGIRKEEV